MLLAGVVVLVVLGIQKRRQAAVDAAAVLPGSPKSSGKSQMSPSPAARPAVAPMAAPRPTIAAVRPLAPVSVRTSIADLERLADRGSAKSQVELAKRYAAADGVDRDDFLSRNWLEKAAKQNYAEAQFLLAGMHFRGEAGFTADNAAGTQMLAAAAKSNYAPALFELGETSRYGRHGAAVDWRAANSYLQRAAAAGSAQGAASLASLQKEGEAESAKARKMNPSQLASCVGLSDLTSEGSYSTFKTDTYVEPMLGDHPAARRFRVHEGETVSELQGAVVRGRITSAFKNVKVKLTLQIAFETGSFLVQDSVYDEAYPSKSFQGAVTDVEIEPGKAVEFEKWFDTKVKGEFKGFVLNAFNVVPEKAGSVNASTLKATIVKAEIVND